MKTRTINELLAAQDKLVRDTESQEQQRAIDKVDSWVPVSGSSGIRWAFCSVNAGTGNTIVCELDVKTTGLSITVTCTIRPNTPNNLNAAVPRLTSGTRIPVLYDATNSKWRCLWGFIGSDTC